MVGFGVKVGSDGDFCGGTVSVCSIAIAFPLQAASTSGKIPMCDQPLDLSTVPLLEMALILNSSRFASARHCYDPLSGLPASCKDYPDPPP